MEKMTEEKTKTTIYIDKDLWNEFSHQVIDERGPRKKNEVIEELVERYVEEEE